MTQKFYSPDFYAGLYGWNHGFFADSMISGTDLESSIHSAGLNFTCLDNRVIFGTSFCRPGSDIDNDRFVWELAELVPGGLSVEEWLLADPDNPDRPIGYEGSTDPNRALGYPPGTEVFGPTMRDIYPAPDFAQVTIATDRTNWWGYHESCFVDPLTLVGKGCGRYRFWQPGVDINASGTPRVGVVDGTIFGSLAGEDPDPSTLGLLTYTDEDHPSVVVEPPLTSGFTRVGFIPALGGLLRPPVSAYVPSPESSDVRNTATKELWAWSDVMSQQVSVEYGTNGSTYWRVGFGDTTSDVGQVAVLVRPFWLINPVVETPGELNIGPMVSHHRQVRGGRAGHRGGSAN